MNIQIKNNKFNSNVKKIDLNNKFQITKIKRKGKVVLEKENVQYKEFSFNYNLRSEKIEEENFTNYVKSYLKYNYRDIEEVFDKIQLEKCVLSDVFRLLDNDDDKSLPQYQRLERIIKKFNGIEKVPDLMKFAPIYKENNKSLESVRIYVHYDKNNERFELYLIDLYHLGIDAKYNERYDLIGRYKANKENKICISKISDKYV